MIYQEDDDLYVYHNKVKMIEIGFRFVDSWFKLVCGYIDRKSAGFMCCGGGCVVGVVVVVAVMAFVEFVA